MSLDQALDRAAVMAAFATKLLHDPSVRVDVGQTYATVVINQYGGMSGSDAEQIIQEARVVNARTVWFPQSGGITVAFDA